MSAAIEVPNESMYYTVQHNSGVFTLVRLHNGSGTIYADNINQNFGSIDEIQAHIQNVYGVDPGNLGLDPDGWDPDNL